ncbi:MAG: arsenite methyltransferase [Candidatus Delongbacteria bacterium]|nr:arsenite methyltransferase [Candidatus Delongbacteria bacterium]
MSTMKFDQIRQGVRKSYASVANANAEGCCGPNTCCGDSGLQLTAELSTLMGYSQADLDLLPEGANMGLGCGNPQAIAELKSGETVLDLGAGGGVDCFLAALKVGKEGFVIGVDMTPDMVSKARANAEKGDFPQVDFRLGEIENLPVGDGLVDVILSNCVINLSPDKARVFREAFRVLKPGGRLAISDVVATAPIPDEIRNDTQLYSACVSGAEHMAVLGELMEAAGFERVRIVPKDSSRELVKKWAPGMGLDDLVTSASIQAVKPGGEPCCGPDCCD